MSARLLTHALLWLLLAYWTIQLLTPYSTGSAPWIFLDNLNLLVHEAGHWIFMPFGEFMHILGGSLNQCLIPAVFLGYFAYRRDLAGSAFSCFWLGDNFVNVSYYIGDARSMALPLLGGDTSGHDWHNLLDMLDVLPADTAIATIVRVLGDMCLIAALGLLALAILIAWASGPQIGPNSQPSANQAN